MFCVQVLTVNFLQLKYFILTKKSWKFWGCSSDTCCVSAHCWLCSHAVSPPQGHSLYNSVSVSTGSPDTHRMELTTVLPELRSLGFSHVSQLLALLCLTAATYKLTVLLARRRRMMSILEVFPGPPGHWLFGNVLEVKSSKFECLLYLFYFQACLCREFFQCGICLSMKSRQGKVQFCVFLLLLLLDERRMRAGGWNEMVPTVRQGFLYHAGSLWFLCHSSPSRLCQNPGVIIR